MRGRITDAFSSIRSFVMDKLLPMPTFTTTKTVAMLFVLYFSKRLVK